MLTNRNDTCKKNRIFGKKEKTDSLISSKPRNAQINVFSVASGKLYERFLSIMMASVMKHTDSTVKFWFIENFLSPEFKVKDQLCFVRANPQTINYYFLLGFCSSHGRKIRIRLRNGYLQVACMVKVTTRKATHNLGLQNFVFGCTVSFKLGKGYIRGC